MRITKLALTDQAGTDYEVQRTDQMKHVLKLVAQLDLFPMENTKSIGEVCLKMGIQ